MEKTNVAAKPIARLALGVYIALLNFLLTGSVVWLWPLKNKSAIAIPLDIHFLLLTALCGSLGSSIHLSTSFVEYAGQDRLKPTWMWWYFLRPWIGSALALVVYFVLRAGLITGASDQSTEALNPYGIAAIAALTGMFSKQATEKLRDTFEHLCYTEKGMYERNEPAPRSDG